MNEELRVALMSIVQRFGVDEVENVLQELDTRTAGGKSPAAPRRHSARGDAAGGRHRLTALEYVQKMDMSAERADVIRRAAKEFEQRTFLPTLGDIRSFCETYGIDEPRSKSRVGGIPRIFKFLTTMESAEVERMLDDRLFSGPVELGPIAEAIRGKAKQYREATAGGR